MNSGISSLNSGLDIFSGVQQSMAFPSEWVSLVGSPENATTSKANKIVRVLMDSQDWARKSVVHEAADKKVFEATFSTLERLAEFSELQDGWDIDDIAPISKSVLEMAADQVVEFAWLGIRKNGLAAEIKMPEVLPTNKGGIQFEWHHKNRDLEIELLPSGLKHALLEKEDEAPLELDVSGGFDKIELELSNLLTP